LGNQCGLKPCQRRESLGSLFSVGTDGAEIGEAHGRGRVGR